MIDVPICELCGEQYYLYGLPVGNCPGSWIHYACQKTGRDRLLSDEDNRYSAAYSGYRAASRANAATYKRNQGGG